VKSTPVRGVKEYLKPYVYKLWEGYVRKEMPDRVPFASWVGDSIFAARLSRRGVAEGKPSLNRAYSRKNWTRSWSIYLWPG
jgi:hypothetical protein